ncbi:MAG: hypothetical protein COT45_04930 [bacterium (Candidatus Stahlbacteria) CG08_land_8_20_14_0_20_40_26]|nr:MAG: hypothetical protein COT45_04930 [bacterium (Candidatus Stahlbacteria) CG08_land_8_20_14_0_20_40_26]
MDKKEKVKDYISKHKYFSLFQISNELSLDKKIVKDYLFQFKKEKLLFEAGYGMYSNIEKRFCLVPKSRVNTILNFLKKEFPYTEFIIWNTQQLQPLYYYTQQHHITFIEVEKEALTAFFEAVSKNYRDTLLERKEKDYFNSFEITRNPVVIRNLFSRSPKKGYFPELEKILVDVFVDLDSYRYISLSDYRKIWDGLFSEFRIKIGVLYYYSKRKKCFEKLFSLFTDISKGYGIDLCQIISKSGKSL